MYIVWVRNSPLYGPVAQLVEQCFCKAKVGGSNPLGSTYQKPSFMLGFCMELEQGVSGLLIIFECTAKMWHNISYMEKFQKGFVAPLLIVIIIVIIGGGVYILAKGNFCFIKINGDCKFGQNDSGITNAIRVPIKPGDSQEDVLAKIEAGFSNLPMNLSLQNYLDRTRISKFLVKS